MFYTLQDGTLIEVGKQNFKSETVPVAINGKNTDCPMVSHTDGDIGFMVGEEEVLFHWLKYKREDCLHS